MPSASICASWIASPMAVREASKTLRSRSTWINGIFLLGVGSFDGAGREAAFEHALQAQVGDDLGDRGEHRRGQDLGLVVAELADEELGHEGDGLHLPRAPVLRRR